MWDYYERVASVEIADRLLREIDRTATRLADDALMWKAGDEVLPGLRSVLVHPYTIFYRVNETAWSRSSACYTADVTSPRCLPRRNDEKSPKAGRPK
jgi:plasmid stabilization system protein ParE